jgi:hypothetical protein
MAGTAGWLAAETTGYHVRTIHRGDEDTAIEFARGIMTRRGSADLVVEVTIPVSNYSFNVPLTLALVSGLYSYFAWRRKAPFLEALSILLAVHLLYIYLFGTLQLYSRLAQAGLPRLSLPLQYSLQFLWAFVENMVIRFEPFLIAVYLWLRNSAHPAAPRKTKGR